MYDYKKNINIITTPNGDKVITMNKEILTIIENSLWDASRLHANEGRYATAKDLEELNRVLCDKEDE